MEENEITTEIREIVHEEIEKSLSGLTDYVKGIVPEKGDKGDSYVLSEQDKQEIAQSVKVPVVEKIVEKTEVIREIPIVTNQVTNEIREVAVLDVKALPQYGEQFRDGLELLKEDERLDRSAVKGLEDYEEVSELARQPKVVGTTGIKQIRAGAGVSIDESSIEYPIISVEAGAAVWGGITGTLSDQTDLQNALNAIQTQLDNKLDDTQFSGLSTITVGTVAPVTPATGDLWVDTN